MKHALTGPVSVALLLLALPAAAQPKKALLSARAERPDATCKVGETATTGQARAG